MAASTTSDARFPPDFLTDWVSRQRWYAGKSRAPQLTSVGSWALASDEVGVSIRTHLLLDSASDPPAIYQVPLTRRVAPLLGADHALVASGIDSVDDARFVYDAPHDPAYAAALFALMTDGASAASARGTAMPGVPPLRVVAAKVFRGEQSNTSIICEVRDGDEQPKTVICKIFRTLHDGENPDVAVQAALTAAGATLVPELIGWVSGSWSDPRRAAGSAEGHLAFAQEFLPGVLDAWQVALLAARAGEDFTERARTLGETTARLHQALAEAMPTVDATEERVAQIVDGMRRRHSQAKRHVPEIEASGDAIEAVYAAAQAAEWPRFQRIHADYHLGQVLAVPGRGWKILDFEGEPLRPMFERVQPDCTMRDIAGMVRSFGYVAGEIAIGQAAAANDSARVEQATRWADACRSAFLDGYLAVAGWDPREHAALLDAFELDKAIYEAEYEARNRPSWILIPMLGIRRVLERVA